MPAGGRAASGASDQSRPASSEGFALATWKQLIDLGSMQDGEEHLRATARRPVAKLSPASYAALGETGRVDENVDRPGCLDELDRLLTVCEVGDVSGHLGARGAELRRALLDAARGRRDRHADRTHRSADHSLTAPVGAPRLRR